MKRFSCLTLIIFGMFTSSFSQPQSKPLLLVHGHWHGAWCWRQLVPLLEQKGYKAITFDLPGHGQDTTSVESVTLKTCVDKVVSEANAQPGPVVLLGHSSGGVIISQAADVLGRDKVTSLVYLDAFLPQNGESVFSLAGKYAPSGAPLAQTLLVSADQKTVSLAMEKVDELLYHDCSPAAVKEARTNLRPGPLAVLATPVSLTDTQYGRIPKYYILCTQAKDMDKTNLATNVACQKVYTLASSHSPFLSMPQKLAEILIAIP